MAKSGAFFGLEMALSCTSLAEKQVAALTLAVAKPPVTDSAVAPLARQLTQAVSGMAAAGLHNAPQGRLLAASLRKGIADVLEKSALFGKAVMESVAILEKEKEANDKKGDVTDNSDKKDAQQQEDQRSPSSFARLPCQQAAGVFFKAADALRHGPQSNATAAGNSIQTSLTSVEDALSEVEEAAAAAADAAAADNGAEQVVVVDEALCREAGMSDQEIAEYMASSSNVGDIIDDDMMPPQLNTLVSPTTKAMLKTTAKVLVHAQRLIRASAGAEMAGAGKTKVRGKEQGEQQGEEEEKKEGEADGGTMTAAARVGGGGEDSLQQQQQQQLSLCDLQTAAAEQAKSAAALCDDLANASYGPVPADDDGVRIANTLATACMSTLDLAREVGSHCISATATAAKVESDKTVTTTPVVDTNALSSAIGIFEKAAAVLERAIDHNKDRCQKAFKELSYVE